MGRRPQRQGRQVGGARQVEGRAPRRQRRVGVVVGREGGDARTPIPLLLPTPIPAQQVVVGGEEVWRGGVAGAREAGRAGGLGHRGADLTLALALQEALSDLGGN